MVTYAMLHGRIAVGVDGSSASRRAVLWAAREARIRHCDLVVTHIDHGGPEGPASDAHATDALLAACAATASGSEPAIAVGTLLLHDDVVEGLVGLSRSAEMLVIGVDQNRSRASHGVLGPIEDRVVVHAECPVVVVSDRPQPVGDPRRVLVAWSGDPSPALDAAAAEADLREASLVVVAVDPRVDHPDARVGDRSERSAGLAATASALRRGHPGLTVEVDDSEADAVATLTARAQDATVVVLSCHHADDRWNIRTGSLAGTLMRQAPCPVMLIGRHVGASRPGAQVDDVELLTGSH